MEEAVEECVFVRERLGELFGVIAKNIVIKYVTDSKSLHDALKSTSLVKDKLLRINVAAIKQAIQTLNVTVVWKEGSKMIADGLSKRNAPKDLLVNAVTAGSLSQFI